MRLLIILTGLFLIGCSGGGLTLSSEREPQTVVDMDLLTADSLGDETLELASADPVEESSSGLPAPSVPPVPEVAQEAPEKPKRREFGKRRKSAEKEDTDLIVEPETDQKPSEDVEVPEIPEVEEVSEVVDINNKVDILFVVDGSFSTRDVLRAMPERMDGFIPALDASLDWRVGFIPAHVKRNEDQKLSSMEIDGAIVLERKYITKGTLSKERIFIDTLTRNKNRRRCAFPPECGGRKETPLLALSEYVLSPSRSVETGTRFIRDDAHLAVVIVTDNKENKKQGQVTTADDVLGALAQEFGNDKEFSVHTLTALNDACQGQLRQEHFFAEGNRAGEVLLLARETGGANLSLCSHEYATFLAEAIETSVLGEEVDCSACSANTVAISDQDQNQVQEKTL